MTEPSSNIDFFIGFFVAVLLALLVIIALIKLIDLAFLMIFKKPFYVHLYLRKRKLEPNKRQILTQQFTFYKKLSKRNKRFFEHRMVCFMDDKEFIGRDGAFIDDEKKVLISATAIMLTFGMRDYLIDILEKIIVYPDEFYSVLNDRYHKGEFNPMLKALVFSWKDFEQGYAISDDNINLGIHEFAHAIHINSLKSRDTASIVFSDGFLELQEALLKKELQEKMRDSGYFRDYAFTNQFEFLAVILENFIESPSEFRSFFPEIYFKLRQMFNFRFAGY